jgi:hypothetical protein
MVITDTFTSANRQKKATVSFCGLAEQYVIKFYQWSKASDGSMFWMLDVYASFWTESFREAKEIAAEYAQ